MLLSDTAPTSGSKEPIILKNSLCFLIWAVLWPVRNNHFHQSFKKGPTNLFSKHFQIGDLVAIFNPGSYWAAHWLRVLAYQRRPLYFWKWVLVRNECNFFLLILRNISAFDFEQNFWENFWEFFEEIFEFWKTC